MSAYVHKLDRALRERGFSGRFHLIQSSGGLTALETAAALPVRFLESGRRAAPGRPDWWAVRSGART